MIRDLLTRLVGRTLCVVGTTTLLGLSAAAGAADTGTLIVLNKSEASASLLDLASGQEFDRLDTGVGPHEVAVSPDGRWAVVADYGDQTPGNTLTVLDLVERSVARTIDLGENERPHGILYMEPGEKDGPAGRVLVSTEGSQRLIVVGVDRGEVLVEMETGGRIGHMVAMTPDGRRAFVPHMGSDTVAAFDLSTGERLALIEVGAQPEGIDVHPDGSEVWVTNRRGDTISIIDVETLEVLETIECGEFPIRLKFTPDGRHALVSNAQSGDLVVFDTESREEAHRIPMIAEAVAEKDERLFGYQFEDSPVPVGILVQPDGVRAFVANTNADVISVIDLAEWKLVDRWVAGKEPDGLGWSTLGPPAVD